MTALLDSNAPWRGGDAALELARQHERGAEDGMRW